MKNYHHHIGVLLRLFTAELVSTVLGDEICRATCTMSEDGNEECVFHSNVNLYAGELGYYAFEECGVEVNPSLGIELGKTYHFIQADRSNYYHPIGFAYYPDGAHDDVDELEPGVTPPGSSGTCADSMTCASPMYFLNGTYLGEYSNDSNIAPRTTGANNFGLDDYEPLFFHPLPEWTSYGEFSVTLKFDDEEFGDDIFYFCHIHQFMTGRIKLLKDDIPVSATNKPEIGYSYDVPSEYDTQCGTYGLNDFQLPNVECRDRFVCDVSKSNADLVAFSDCIESMDCHMMAGMTTGVSSESEIALFLHQMMPHHQNAVNMAKALLKTGKLSRDDISGETADCTLEVILREIINNQNAQIQSMRGLLEEWEYDETDECLVEINTREDDFEPTPCPSKGNHLIGSIFGVVASTILLFSQFNM